jgi:hypothetical protein
MGNKERRCFSSPPHNELWTAQVLIFVGGGCDDTKRFFGL